jgi:outer membrane protein TolC
MYRHLTIIFAALMLVGCHATSYSPKYTEVTFPHYRIPDSLSVHNDTISIASTLWQNYYKDANLRALIDEGIKNNYTLHSALLQIEKAESYFVKSKWNFAPSINIGISQHEQKRSIRENPYNEHGISLTMTNWEIDLWGKLRSTKRASIADLLAKQSSAQAVKTKLIADIATQYYRLICLDAKLQTVNDIIASNEAILSRQIELKEDENNMKAKQAIPLFEKDKPLLPTILSTQISIADVAIEQTKAELYKAQATKPDIEAQIFIVENSINLLLSRHNVPITRSKLEDIISIEDVDNTIEIGVPMHLLRYRPDVMAAEYAVQEAFHLQDAAKAALYPALTIKGGFGVMGSFNATITDFPRSLVYNLFTGLTQPIFQNGALKHNKRIREIEAQQRLDSYKQTLLKACVEVSNTLVFYQQNKTKLNKLLKQHQALNRAYSYSKYLYENGQASYIDLLAAQRPMLQTKFNLAEAFTNYYINYIDLYKALGGGTK